MSGSNLERDDQQQHYASYAAQPSYPQPPPPNYPAGYVLPAGAYATAAAVYPQQGYAGYPQQQAMDPTAMYMMMQQYQPALGLPMVAGQQAAVSHGNEDHEVDDPKVYLHKIKKEQSFLQLLQGRMPVHGNGTTFNINSLLHQNILESEYFKALYQLRTYHEVIDEVYRRVTHVGPWQTGTSRIPSTGK